MNAGKILLCDFEPTHELGGSLRLILESSAIEGVELRHEIVEVRRAAFGPQDLVRLIERVQPSLAFFVLSRGTFRRAKGLFDAIRRCPNPVPAMVVINGGDSGETLELLKIGAVDFVTAPLRAIEILPRVWRLLEKTRSTRTGSDTQEPEMPEALRRFVGQNASFRSQVGKIPTVARCDSGVLILGETGTGKELFARAIHEMSSRANEPFATINCGAIPVDLAESEIFGHERGAFTGALAVHAGMVEEAEGGTLFLDEVACLPLLAQAKMLRFLQEKEFRPVGASKCRHANVRVIAATNERLEKAVSDGRFRHDLFYRLNVVPMILPPLRERRDDIPLLARHFLARFNTELNTNAKGFSPEAIERLTACDWPGNVRELEHAVERAVVFCNGEEISAGDLGLLTVGETRPAESFQVAKANVIAQFERSRIQTLLASYKGNVTQAAKAAGKNRRAFWELVRKHGIDADDFRPAAVG